MRCLFCKKDSTESKSVEHIIPESLGNSTLILSIGCVCDKCNNYFAREVEKPFLEQMSVRLLRFQESVPNKKNRIPTVKGILNGQHIVEVHKKLLGDEIVTDVALSPEVFNKVSQENKLELTIPAFTDDIVFESSCVTSRFLAKMALEALAAKLVSFEGGLDSLIDDRQYDPVRNHARQGTIKDWPCSIRRIYSTNKKWNSGVGDGFQVIHESDFLFPTYNASSSTNAEYISSEIYFVVVLWGIEFAINMGGPELDGYEQWLKEHNNISPLYFGKNKDVIQD